MNYVQKIFSYTVFFLLLGLNNISPAYYDTKNNESDLTKNTTFESFNTISETIIALDTTQKKIKTILQNSQNNTQNKSSQRNQSETTLINKKEINEYKVFINYLSIQINYYCTEIYHKYGSDALLSLPCENEMTYSPLDKDNSSLTMNEQIESLDDELMNSLGTFDEMLLKEEEIIALQSRKSQSYSASSSGIENSDNSAGNSSNKKGQIEEKRSGNNKEMKEKKYSEKEKNTKASSANKQSNRKQSKKKQNERRKLDEIDDDIVARQLKEAAEKEKDPALKKKLWDEYYKYKKKNIKS